MKEKSITRMSLDDVQKTKGKTDLARLAAAQDEDGVEEEFDWETVEIVRPEPKAAISLRIDPDILEFFKKDGKGYQTRINTVLKSYVRAHQKG
jgi:uncharacterized protein (DUF4415 family)